MQVSAVCPCCPELADRLAKIVFRVKPPTVPVRPTLVFDFDGVLADSLGVEQTIINTIAKRRGAAPMSRTEILATPRPRLPARLNVPGWLVPYYIRFAYSQMRALRADIRLHPDIVAAFAWAHQVDVRCIILSSNAPEVIRSFLQRHLPAHQDIMVVGKVHIFGKGEALRRLQRSGITQMVYIGDEVRDINAANGASIRSIGVGWGKDSLDALIAAGCHACARDGRELQQQVKSEVRRMCAAIQGAAPADTYEPPRAALQNIASGSSRVEPLAQAPRWPPLASSNA